MADSTVHSPFRTGSDQGFFFGLYLICIYAVSIVGQLHDLTLLLMLSMAMVFSVPFIIYRCLRKSYDEVEGKLQFSALWMQGIVIFICGTLVAAIPLAIYLRFINPYFIVDQLKGLIDIYSVTEWEGGRQTAEVLQAIIDNKMVPSAMDIALETVWLGVFSGSLLSLLMGLLVTSRRRPSAMRPRL